MTREGALRLARPILFNTDMVRAILDRRKKVTRRVVKYKYCNTEMKMRTDKYGTRLIEIQKDVEGETYGKNPNGGTWHRVLPYIEKNPPYKYNDVLYVRETWCQVAANIFWYKADSKIQNILWHPSIHMPKDAARIFLRVTGVKEERLQEITDEQAEKEGCSDYTSTALGFSDVWDSTIKKSDIDKYGWKANPWVWVIGFEVIEVG